MVRPVPMGTIYLYWPLLLATFAYALVRGSAEERFVAAVCVFASLATKLVVSPLADRYSQVENGVFLVDIAVLGAFTVVALRSQRFWPLWIAGLQLTSSMSHFLKAANLDMMPQAYAAAERFWSYPVLLIIIVGTWRARRRTLQLADSASLER